MYGNKRSRPALWLAVSTLTAVAAVGIFAPAQGVAAVQEYATSYEASCVLGPGTLNVAGRVPTNVRLSGPEYVAPSQEVTFREASVTIKGPPEWTEDLAGRGVAQVKGTLSRFFLEAVNMKPFSVNLAAEREGSPANPRFQATLERGKPLTWGTPRSGPFSETVTGAAGEHAVFAIENASAFEELEVGYRATGVGSSWSFEGFGAHGENVLGPTTIACHAPTGVNLAVIPIERPEYKNWTLAGVFSPKKLKQSISLPTTATFSGLGELAETGIGEIAGAISVPPFASTIKLFGVVPMKLGMTAVPAGPVNATLADSPSVPGDEMLTLPLRLDLGVTSVSLLGLTIPTTCATVEPLSLELAENLTREELLHKGWSFAGSASLPGFQCQGGLLGALFKEVLNGLFAGPEMPYALSVTAPTA